MKFKASTPPPGCVDLKTHERELCATAELLEQKARVLLESDQRIGLASANQLMLAAIRARKQAGELAARREDIDHEREAMAHERELLGVRDAPRPRLRMRKP